MSDMLIWELYKRFRSLGVDPAYANELTQTLVETSNDDMPPMIVQQDYHVFLVKFKEKVA